MSARGSRVLRAGLGALILILPLRGEAHVTATGLATLEIDAHGVDYRLTVILGEIDQAAAELLRRAGDGAQASAAEVAALMERDVALSLGDTACAPGLVRIQASRLGEERVTLQRHFDCPERGGDLILTERWADTFGAHYRSIVDVRSAGQAQQFVLDPDHPSALVSRLEIGYGWLGFIRLGMSHILTGYDHVLFVAALLLGSQTLLQVLAVVTAFTVAHSVTLAAAVLGLASIPSAVIEPLIAASIVFVAVENLVSSSQRPRWLVTFGFGLVHGFGFAGVLQELELGGAALARALVGFNLGVEVGQAAIILLCWPLLWLARRHLRPRWSTRAPSVAIALCGAIWLFVRLVR